MTWGGGGKHLFTSQLIKIKINTVKKQQLIIIDTKQEIILFNKLNLLINNSNYLIKMKLLQECIIYAIFINI